MANSYYQTPTTPRLYVSYPLWQYANGGLDFYALGGSAYSDGVNVIDEDLIKLIQLDPSNPVSIDWHSSSALYIGYGVVPSSHIEYLIKFLLKFL